MIINNTPGISYNNAVNLSYNEKMINDMDKQSTIVKQAMAKLQSKEPTYDAPDLSTRRANYRKSAESGTQSVSTEGQNAIDNTLQRMRSLADNARADSSAQTANAGASAEQINAAMQGIASKQDVLNVPISNIQSTGSGSNVADANMAGGNEASDFSRFNAIAQQGADMLYRGNAGSGQASNAGAEAASAASAASNSQLSEASSAMASKAAEQLNSAMQRVTSTRDSLGANMEKLQSSVDRMSPQISSEDLANAEQRIKDLEMSNEMMSFSKYNILTQQATAMLSQANQAPQQALQLLGR